MSNRPKIIELARGREGVNLRHSGSSSEVLTTRRTPLQVKYLDKFLALMTISFTIATYSKGSGRTALANLSIHSSQSQASHLLPRVFCPVHHQPDGPPAEFRSPAPIHLPLFGSCFVLKNLRENNTLREDSFG